METKLKGAKPVKLFWEPLVAWLLALQQRALVMR